MKIPRETEDCVYAKFGEHNSFSAYIYEGWLLLICGGGTGFCKKTKEPYVVLPDMANMSEYDVIRYCNKHNFLVFNYYDFTASPGPEIIYHYDENKKLTIIQ